MKTKTRLTALIIATCLVVASSIGIIAWALAAANIGIGSKLSVTYEAAPHVVCTASATYQKTTDASATPFQSGTIDMNYGDTSGSRTLNASNSALVLNDTNKYVVFEFTFTNNNKMNTMGINIVLTDNGICSNMTRKYYFGDLSSKTISEKESTIKSSGIENSALSTKSVTLKQNKTTRIYMLLEITPGIVANYNADSTNKFLFTLTSVEVDPNATVVSYLSKDWINRIGRSKVQNAKSIIFTNDESRITGLQNSVSVGTINQSSTTAFVETDGVQDVKAYWDNDLNTMAIYSSGIIYAPENSANLFEIDYYDNEYLNATVIELSNFDTSLATNMFAMFRSCFYVKELDLGNFDMGKVDNGVYSAGVGKKLSLFDLAAGNYALIKFVAPYNVIEKTSYGNGGEIFMPDGFDNITSENCSTKTKKVVYTKK